MNELSQGEAVGAQLKPEDVVRKFFDCYTNGRPEDFDRVVAPDYVDYGHTPPGRGPDGARDDYENAVKQAGGVIRYTIDGLVVDGDMVAASAKRMRKAAGPPLRSGPLRMSGVFGQKLGRM